MTNEKKLIKKILCKQRIKILTYGEYYKRTENYQIKNIMKTNLKDFHESDLFGA